MEGESLLIAHSIELLAHVVVLHDGLAWARAVQENRTIPNDHVTIVAAAFHPTTSPGSRSFLFTAAPLVHKELFFWGLPITNATKPVHPL